MNDDRGAHHTPGSNPGPAERLDSWKEIASYLGRGIRTVQRWEREEGLPVHRLAHEKRGSVYARREELAAWWESRRLTLAAEPAGDRETTPRLPRLERLTRTSAAISWPALSSDARLLAHVSDAGQEDMTPQVWLQQIGGAAIRLTSGQREYSSLSFSADDTRVVFTAKDAAGQHVYEVPTLGGELRLLKQAATCARFSPDGRWLAYVSLEAGAGVRISTGSGAGFRTLAPELLDVVLAAWSSDSQALLVSAHPEPGLEPEWWIVPIDGRSPTNTGIMRKCREEGLFALPFSGAWVHDSVVFTVAGRDGVSLWQQPISRATFQASGAPVRLTAGNEAAQWPFAAGGRIVFTSTTFDANLWSVAIDESGAARGPLRRMTRGPGILGFLSATSDGTTLAYFSVRLGLGDVFVRDLRSGAETVIADRTGDAKGFPALSPSGRQLAYSTRVPGERAMRPLFIHHRTDGAYRQLCEDCGGRPRQWLDERWLLIERFARLNSIALIDAETGEQRELLASAERSVKNPQASPDGRWIAFDAARHGEPPSVFVAPLDAGRPVLEMVWMVIERSASHPFWSADSRLLYSLPMGVNPLIRGVVQARRIDDAGRPDGASIPVYASNEMRMPAFLNGTGPIATSDQIIFILGDFRGDVWMMDLDPAD
jgi:Tol biopolymer transport system component